MTTFDSGYKKIVQGLVIVDGAVNKEANTAEALQAVFAEGLTRRHSAATRMNAQSSRSHLMFTCLLTTSHLTTGAKSQSKLTFVDLAGSERVAKSGAIDDPTRLNEAKAINKSLSALGDVVSALTTGVPSPLISRLCLHS